MQKIKKIVKACLRFLGICIGEVNLDLLKSRGLKVGNNFYPQNANIDYSHVQHITIGDNVTFGPKVLVLAHDASTKMFLGYTKVKNTFIGNNVFIGANTTVLAGSHIGDNVIIGAASLVSGEIPSGTVAAGNPARVICRLEDYLEKQKAMMNNHNCFDEQYTFRNKGFTSDMRDELVKSCDEYGIIFLR